MKLSFTRRAFPSGTWEREKKDPSHRKDAKPQNVYPQDASHYYLFSLRAVGFVPLCLRGEKKLNFCPKDSFGGTALKKEFSLEGKFLRTTIQS